MIRAVTMSATQERPSLIADIGATNARFGLTGSKGLIHSRILQCANYASLEAAAQAYLADLNLPEAPVSAAIAVASPITSDRINLTNNPWSFSIKQTCKTLGLEHLKIVNDFTALALGIPLLKEADRRQVGPGQPLELAPIGIIGPGTGLGVSGLVHNGTTWTALATEGGHVTMAATNEREAEVLRILRTRMDHVSAERVISGMGLQNLYAALCTLTGEPERILEPAQIADAGLSGQSAVCREVLEMFCSMLGTVAGNLALSLGARGGIYIAGGIVPRFGDFFDHSNFREKFEAKGRMRAYLAPIPTYVVTHELPAFLGLEVALTQP